MSVFKTPSRWATDFGRFRWIWGVTKVGERWVVVEGVLTPNKGFKVSPVSTDLLKALKYIARKKVCSDLLTLPCLCLPGKGHATGHFFSVPHAFVCAVGISILWENEKSTQMQIPPTLMTKSYYF